MNNAGVMALSPIGNGRVEDWDHMIDLNIKGFYTVSTQRYL